MCLADLWWQRGVESQQLFPQYAETILQLTQKANKRQRKSRSKKKPGADDDDEDGAAGRKKKKRRGSKMSQSQQYQDLFGEGGGEGRLGGLGMVGLPAARPWCGSGVH